MRRYPRNVLNPPHTLLARCSEAYEDQVDISWNCHVIQDPLLEVPPTSAHSANRREPARAMQWPGANKTINNHSKTAPFCSARPVLAKRLPPSVLAVRRDLRVFPCPKLQKQANHNGQRAQTGEAFWATRAWRCRRVLFLSDC